MNTYSHKKRNRVFMTTTGILICLGIAYIDFQTGTELSLSVFYIIPVFMIVWYNTFWHGVAISVCATVLYLLGENMANIPHSSAEIPYWNAAVHCGFLLIVTYMLSKLKDMLLQQRQFANIDHLTGVLNSRMYSQKLDEEKIRAKRYSHPLTIVYIDLDDFKRINDRYGHASGGQVLKIIAATLEAQLRATDCIARLGGDEFALLLPETSQDQARAVLKKIQTVLPATLNEYGWNITLSMGAVTFRTFEESVGTMISHADDLMYKAKNKGKNQIVMGEYKIK